MRPFSNYWSVFDFVGKQNQLSQLEKDVEHPDFWNDSTTAQKLMKDLSNLRDEVGAWTKIKQQIHDLTELVKLGDDSLYSDLEIEIEILKTRGDTVAGSLRALGGQGVDELR